MKRCYFLIFFLAPTFLFGQIRNILLEEGTPTNLVCEPSVAINPRNPLNVVAASENGNVYTTFDGGKTWDKKKLVSTFGVFGNPVLLSDSKGVFYYLHLSDPSGEGRKNEKSLDVIVCQVSEDGGKTWDGGNPIGYNPPKDQDKPWASVDGKGNIYVAWTQFDKYLGKDTGCTSTVMLSSSPNGKKWAKPLQISNITGDCLDDDQSVAGAVPAISDDKRVFVAWAHGGKLYLDRSFDGGSMWLSQDIAIGDQPGGWRFNIDGHERANGLPTLLVDRSKTERKGFLYLMWTDQRDGVSDSDVWFMRSNSYGDYWTSPIGIGSDNRRHQYFPSMTIDNATGHIYIVYYDRSGYEDHQTDVMLAYSIDGGASFKTHKVSESPFTPNEKTFFGEYCHISAHKGVIAPVWTRMDGDKTSVWTAIIRHEDLPK